MVSVCCLSVGEALSVWKSAPELSGVRLVGFDSTEALLGHHHRQGRCLVVVLGEGVHAPESVAQRLHLDDDALDILILTQPEQRRARSLQLLRTPFLGTHTRLHPLGNPLDVVPVLRDTLDAAQRRRAWRTNAQVLNQDAQTLAPAQPRMRQTLDLLLERAPIGVVMLDSLGRIESYNRLAGQYFRLDGPGPTPRSLFAAVRHDDQALVTALLGAPADPLQGPGEAEIVVDGPPRRLLRLQVAAVDPFAPRENLLLLAQDVTERRSLQEQLFQARKLESIGRLAGGIAHDFNNLLTVILGYAEQIERSLPAGDPRAQDLGQVRYAAERAAALTAQLLTFARRKPVSPGRLDVRRVIDDCARLLERLLGSKVRFVVQTSRDLPEVWIDPEQMQQLLINLAVNARDAMPEGGELTISARAASAGDLPGAAPDAPAVEIEVADTGRGMDAQTLEHIFEPFFTTKELGQGTGLGLATCHGIVERAGGRIRVESRPGVGTRFTLVLPVAGAAGRA